ncbi:MAG: S8 family serine peptidase [Phycisphaerales bacterium]|nr:S8 family serine peptidase [Phycisphaerales bacterium]
MASRTVLLIATAALAAPSTLAAREASRPAGAVSGPARWIARSISTIDRAAVRETIESLGASVIREMPAIREYVILADAPSPDSLRATGLFEYVVPDELCYPLETPDDPLFPGQWHLPRIEAPAAWTLAIGSESVIIAVVDGGVDLDHPDLQPRLVPGYNSVDRLAQADGGLVTDVNGHGSSVAGAAGATGDNGEGVAGVGWQMSIMPIRASNSGSGAAFLSDLLDGARWAVDHGAHCVNVSYTGVQNASVQATGEYVMQQGGLLFWSAGNRAQQLDYFDHAAVIVVGSTTPEDARSDFSAFGVALDVFAPGQDILTTTIDGYGPATGTSFAAPIAAGVAGMIRSAAPGLTAAQVQSVLFDSCDDIGSPGDDAIFGRGRVNLRRAVQLARALDCEADLDADRDVDLEDLTRLLAEFGGSGPAADLDADGRVGIADLARLLSRFGGFCD